MGRSQLLSRTDDAKGNAGRATAKVLLVRSRRLWLGAARRQRTLAVTITAVQQVLRTAISVRCCHPASLRGRQ
jgi:hypothetical protein